MELRVEGFVVMLVGCGILFLAVHMIGKWLRREITPDSTSWSARMSAIAVGIVLLMFVAGIGMVGITHQVLWLVTAPEPLSASYISGVPSQKFQLQSIGMGFSTTLDAHGWDQSPEDEELSSQSWIAASLAFTSFHYDERWDKSKSWDHPDNFPVFSGVPQYFVNPSLPNVPTHDESGYGLTHYSANSQILRHSNPLYLSVRWNGIDDNRLFVGETRDHFQPWGKPGANRRDASIGLGTATGFSGPVHENSTLFVRVGGSVDLINNDIDPEVLKNLARPQADHE